MNQIYQQSDRRISHLVSIIWWRRLNEVFSLFSKNNIVKVMEINYNNATKEFVHFIHSKKCIGIIHHSQNGLPPNRAPPLFEGPCDVATVGVAVVDPLFAVCVDVTLNVTDVIKPPDTPLSEFTY